MEAYPLYWPLNKPRTPADKRKSANFHTRERKSYTAFEGSYSVKKQISVYEAVNRIRAELDAYSRVGHPLRVPSDSIIISTNIPVRKDGLPYSSYRKVEDPGVAVYFKLDGRDYCLPCDKWNTVEGNLAAVAAHIGAMRGIERWGVGESHDAYAGFRALPESTMTEQQVWEALGLTGKPASLEALKKAYHDRSKIAHPDKPTGSPEAFQKVQTAYEFAIKLFQ